jgi:tetratricopeptide (TPR) repeat protein
LVASLGRPQALARATRVREKAAQQLEAWSHASYLSEASHIDRLLERGDLLAAHAAAQRLLGKCLAVGETAFPEAAYGIAMAHFKYGHVLKIGGAAEDALVPLAEAQRQFQELGDAGNTSAERMASVAITETGDCLRDLGQLDKAAEAYEERIRRAETMRDLRGKATAKFQLGYVRLLQERYEEALGIYSESRDSFNALGEPIQVAKVWHQFGMVHEAAGQFEPAEQAYRQSLAIKVRENELAGQAPTLDQLGLLYREAQRFEESVVFHMQAAQIRTNLGDLATEGRSRSNLALSLMPFNATTKPRKSFSVRLSAGALLATPSSPGRPGGFWRISSAPPATPRLHRPAGGKRARSTWPIAALVASARATRRTSSFWWAKRSRRAPNLRRSSN